MPGAVSTIGGTLTRAIHGDLKRRRPGFPPGQVHDEPDPPGRVCVCPDPHSADVGEHVVEHEQRRAAESRRVAEAADQCGASHEHGRTADLVNVAGKRSSFGYLNTQLNAIPGVIDGAFFLREGLTGSTGVARLGCVVVAPA